MQFVEIDFMSAMKMLDEGEIESLYFWSSGSVRPVKDFEVPFDSLKGRRYLRKIEAKEDAE